jgi:large conductance mechanosensitive channel
MKQFFKDFKAFAMKGNVLDLAVGVIIGGAFGKIVASLVNDIVMPLIGLIVGNVNLAGAFYPLNGKIGEYTTIEATNKAGIGTLNYGMFLQTIIDFLLIALCIFLFIKLMARLSFKKKEEAKPSPAVRLCRFCKQPVHEEATRCPHCTSEL